MIYLKNIREIQTVYIPRTEINGKVVAVKSYDEGYADGKEEGKKLQKLKLTNLTVSENGVYKREDGWNEVDIDVKPSLQSKTINVTKDVETVMADDAFDGLSRVDVNATQYGRDKRNEGYNQGYLEGEDYGYTEGKTEGYNQGKNDGIQEGYSEGKEDGIQEGYSEGKNDGIVEGYADGKTDGINEQKSKLESITITENGTYVKEDGYNSISVNVEDLNGSYDDGYNAGYDDGQTNAGKTARVLNITENGIYTTKYSEPNEANAQVTGYFDDNTPFYGYAHLTNHTIATGIMPTKTSRVELWWRPDFHGSGTYQYIFSNTSPILNGICLKVDGGKFSVRFGNYTKNNQLAVEDKWYHIVVSTDGLVIDGERITTLGTPSMFIAGTGLFINGDGVTTIGNVCANGYFGMVKIDGKTFIPTEDGFIDYTTDTILTVYKEGHYDFEKPTYEGNLIRTIRVSVAGGSDDGYDDGYNAGYFVGQTEGYNAGKTDGIQEGYADGVVEGKELGINEQKSKLESIEVTVNGTYTKEDGYDSIVVKVPDENGSYDEGYTEGYEVGIEEGYSTGKSDGISEQKSKLTNYVVNENGTYTREDGYNLVLVSVPQTNYKTTTEHLRVTKDSEELIPDEGYAFTKVTVNATDYGQTKYDLGYNSGYDEGYDKGYEVGSSIQKISMRNGTKFAYSTFKKIPLSNLDWYGVKDMSFMFYECENLEQLYLVDTSSVTTMYNAFYGCRTLETIPLLDTSKVTDMQGAFYACKNLIDISEINTSNVTNMNYMFWGCTSLNRLPALDCSKVTSIDQFFGDYRIGNLLYFGGFINLKCSMLNEGLENTPNLTIPSCINVLNGLYDFTGNGETPTSSQGKLKVHQNFLDNVGDQISIGINKGWTITA